MSFFSNLKSGIRNQWVVLSITLGYALAVSIISGFHEVWRDEVVVMNLIAENKSLPGLFKSIHNYGHPGLWCLILYIFYAVFHKYCILCIVNIAISVSAVYIFLLKAPFRLYQKILFICGYFPIYLYPAFSRNYGISMLLLFVFCVLYKNRFRNFIPISIVLFLLANTHAHSLIIVIAIFISFIYEFITLRKDKNASEINYGKLLLGSAVIAAGIVLSLWQIVPDESSIIFRTSSLKINNIMIAFLYSLLLPGKQFIKVFGFESALFANIIIWGMYVYLLRKPRLLIIFLASVIGLAMFFILIYPTVEMRHQGALFILMIAVLWLDEFSTEREIKITGVFDRIIRVINAHRNSLLGFLLLMQLCLGYSAVKNEIKYEYSSSKSLAEFLKKDPRLNGAILIGEPDYLMEALPYYTDIQIYSPRLRRFVKHAVYTTEATLKLSLDDLLVEAEKLKKKYHRPVIILVGHVLCLHGPFVKDMPYHMTFTYSEKSLKNFYRKTIKIKDFRVAFGDENYTIFLLK